MRVVCLIDFPDNLAQDLSALSAQLECHVRRHEAADQIPANAIAAFVCGDRAGWLDKICQIGGHIFYKMKPGVIQVALLSEGL